MNFFCGILFLLNWIERCEYVCQGGEFMEEKVFYETFPPDAFPYLIVHEDFPFLKLKIEFQFNIFW